MTGTHLKEKAKELFDQNSNWVAVGVGIKEIAGASTGHHSVTLYVNEKKPLEDVAEADRFPSSVTVDGVDYPTDVVEQPNPEPLAMEYCYTGLDPSDSTDITVMPLSANNSVRRPLIGGIRCSTIPPAGYDGLWTSTGTLGGLVVDNTDNTICGITNAHVTNVTYFSSEATSGESTGSLKGNTQWVENTGNQTFFSYLCTGAIERVDIVDATIPSGSNGSIELTEEIGNYPFYQMTAVTSNEAIMEIYKVGSVKRTSLMPAGGGSSATTRMDAALVTIEPANCKSAQDGSSVNYQQIVPGESPEGTYEGTINGVDYGMEFATTAEIESLTDTQFFTDENGLVPEAQDGTRGPLVFKSGRRTGPTGSPGTLASYPVGQAEWCPTGMLSAFGTTNIRVAYSDNVPYSRVLDCLEIRGTVRGSFYGDSGSLLCARIPISVDAGPPYTGVVTYSEWKIIGQLFAGAGLYFVAARIDNMAEDLDIRAYRGAGTLEFATLENKQTRITTGYSSDLTMTHNGKKYWQAGKTEGPAEDV